MRKAKIPLPNETTFANALISYVLERPSGVPTRDLVYGGGPVPDHWTSDSRRSDYDGPTRGSRAAAFDALLEREPALPRLWEGFRRQYLSPVADLLDRLLHECDYPSSRTWNGAGWKRNDFFTNGGDLYTRKTQEETYRHLLQDLERRGLLRRQASRRYEADPEAAQVLTEGTWTDIPGSYRRLKQAVSELGRAPEHESATVFPGIRNPYGDRVPTLFLLGDTLTRTDRDRLDGFRFISERMDGVPRHQEILYVLAEARGTEYIPRGIGRLEAYLIEFSGDVPIGKRYSDLSYLVPQDDMTEEEHASLKASHQNWEASPFGWLDEHPGLKAHIMGREE